MVAAFVIGIGIGLTLGILLGLAIADMSAPSTLLNIPMLSGPIYGNVTGIIDANTLGDQRREGPHNTGGRA